MFFHTLSILMAQKLIFVEFFKKSSKIWNFGRYLVLIRPPPLSKMTLMNVHRQKKTPFFLLGRFFFSFLTLEWEKKR